MALLLYWKERGPTSQQALYRLSKILNVKRARGRSNMGHSGTLDPFAEGLLLVGTGEGTKLLGPLTGLSKTYIATFDWDHHSETFDTESEALPNNVDLDLQKSLTQEKISSFLNSKVGLGSQVPPQTSAVHVDGKRAYEWARAGIQKELKARDFEILSIELLSWKWPELKIRVEVTSGTYIRSLARDWGLELLGTPGRLTSLVRCGLGPWSAEAKDFSVEPKTQNLNLDQLRQLFSLQTLDIGELPALRNGQWRGKAQGKTLILGPEGQILAWAIQDGAIERLFLEDPLKIVE